MRQSRMLQRVRNVGMQANQLLTIVMLSNHADFGPTLVISEYNPATASSSLNLVSLQKGSRIRIQLETIIQGVTYDSALGQVYWADSSGSFGISRCYLNGSG